jgi:hypothetical protein
MQQRFIGFTERSANCSVLTYATDVQQEAAQRRGVQVLHRVQKTVYRDVSGEVVQHRKLKQSPLWTLNPLDSFGPTDGR